LPYISEIMHFVILKIAHLSEHLERAPERSKFGEMFKNGRKSSKKIEKKFDFFKKQNVL